MPHISLPEGLPGIRGPMVFSPATAKPLNALAELLLRGDDNSLSRGEREFMAAYVSYLNNCHFCQSVHGALAGFYLSCDVSLMQKMKENPEASDLSPKMKVLLPIAAAVQQSGQKVTAALISGAREEGASDREIHDTVLIAAAFCMFNRYVDGLATEAPADAAYYTDRAPRRAEEGYVDFNLHHVSL